MQIRLNTQDVKVIAHELTTDGGILAQLRGLTEITSPNSFFKLKNALQRDKDLQAGDPYDSRARWAIASAKLHLLLLTTSQYLLALKLQIVLYAELYELGHDVRIDQIEPGANNPDNTFPVFEREIDNFKLQLPKLIENVRLRRAGMVSAVEGNDYCEVAYSNKEFPVAQREDLRRRLGRHDALFTGRLTDCSVRSKEDNPSLEEFGTPGHAIFITNGWGYSPASVDFHWWRRLQFRDKAIDDGKDPRDWVLSEGHAAWPYTDFEDRCNTLRQRHITDVLHNLDEWAKLPKVLDDNLTALRDKWTPQLPKQLTGVRLEINEWGGDADKDDLWSDKGVSVRYRFTISSRIGKESTKSSPTISTEWITPKGRCRPRIVGLPTEGEYLDYISAVCLYRQFRKEFPVSREFPEGFKDGPDRLV